MNKGTRKLINDVTHVLKLISESDGIPFNSGKGKNTTVDYDFYKTEAKIYLTPHVTSTGNGYESYYNFKFIDALSELSNKHGISYRIGLTDNFKLHILIYV